MSRPYPELLTREEQRELLAEAVILWDELQKNNLGGFSDQNRPFWIVYTFRNVIEKFGHRDTGMHWTKDQLDAAKAKESLGG